jgi:hypothetical protein
MARRRHAHIFAKEPNGHYVEPAWCSRRLLQAAFTPIKGHVIVDPACGWGTILYQARELGFAAMGSDLVDRLGDNGRKFHFRKCDFLNGYTAPTQGRLSIICNPPFDHVEEFCRQACKIATDKVAMICLLRRLPAAHWLAELPLSRIYFLTPRPSMPPGEWIAAGNKPGGGSQDFCWLVFDLRPLHEPVSAHWLHRDGAA